MHTATPVRTIALFEAAKGLLVLLAGLGLPRLLHSDALDVAARALEHLHLNPAHHSPTVFLDALENMSDTRLHWLAAGAAAYAVVRFVEAYGLWRDRAWAEWFAAISGGIYVPFEVATFIRRQDAWSGGALALNLAIVAFMVVLLVRRRSRSASATVRN